MHSQVIRVLEMYGKSHQTPDYTRTLSKASGNVSTIHNIVAYITAVKDTAHNLVGSS